MTASAPTSASRRPRRWRWVLVAVALLLAVLWLLRGPLLGPLVARQLAKTLSGALGGPVTVARARGGWLHDAEVDGIASAPRLPATVRFLEVGRLAIRHDLRLLRGDLAGLSRVEASGVRVDLALPASEGPAGGPWPPVLEWLPDPLPALDVGGGLSLRQGDELLEIPGLSLQGGGERAVVAVHGLTIHGLPPQDFALALRRRDRATLVLAGPAAIAGVTLTGLELTLGAALQRVSGTVAAWGGTLTATATPTAMDVALRGLDLAALPAVVAERLGPAWSPLAGRVDGNLAAQRQAAAPGGWAVSGSVAVAEGSIGGHAVHALRCSAALTADGVRVSDLAVDVEGGLHLQSDDLEVARLGSLWLPRRGRITVVIDDLRPWLARAGVPAPWLPAQAIALTGIVALDAGTVTVERVRVVTPGLTLDGSGSLSALVRHIGGSDLAVHADLTQLATQVPALAGAAGVLDLRLRYSGFLPRSPLALLAGKADLSIAGSGFAWRGIEAPLLALAAHSADGAAVVTAGELEVAGLSLRTAGRAAPRASGWDLEITRLALAGRGMEAALTAPLPLRFGAEGWSFGPLRASVPGGALIASGSRFGALQLAATLSGLDLAVVGAAVGRPDLAGNLVADLSARGDPAQPGAELTLQARGLRFAGREGTFALEAVQDGGGIHLRTCDIDLGRTLVAHGAGTWPATMGRDGIAIVAGDPDLNLDASADDLSRITGALTAGKAALSLRSADGRTMRGVLALRGLRLRPADADRPGRRLEAPEAIDADLRLGWGGTGATVAVSASLAGHEVVNGEVASPGAFVPRALAARPLAGSLVLSDLPLEQLIGAIPGLLQGTGRVSGRATLGGTIAAPTVDAEVLVADGEFKVTNDMPTITGVAGGVTLHGRQVTLRNVHADLGYAPGTVDGTIDLAGGDGPAFALHLTGENLLLSQSRDLRLRADTDLHLEGPLRSLLVRGEVVITDALYSRRVELLGGKGDGIKDDQVQLFSLRDPPLADMRFDVAVRTSVKTRRSTRKGHEDERIPDAGLRIANNLLRASATVALHLRGTGALPQPTGSVTARESVVTLPFSTLTVERAEVVFPPGDPFAPTIAAVARAQVRQYAVTVEVEGPLRDPVIHAASPGMEERDALLLLTAGATTAELEDPDGQRAALGRVGTWLGRETWRVISGPGDPDGKPSPLDFLTIEIGRAVSDSGRDTIEAEFRLNPPERTTGVYLAGERDRYDDYNMGFVLRWRWGGSP